MLRVLHVLNELRRSGAEVMLAAAAPHFLASGYETHVLSTGQTRGGFAPVLENAGCVVHHLPFSKDFEFFLLFRRLVEQVKPDIVHIHCERASVAYAVLAAPTARVVRTIHSWFEFTGALRWRKTAERWLCRSVLGATIIAPSPSVQDNERHRFANQAVLCPNWYDDRRFFPPTEEERRTARYALGFAPEDFVVVSVGAHERVKNLDCALRALAQVRTAQVRTGRPVRFLHVGRSASVDGADSLPRLASMLGLTDVVRFTGETDDVPGCLHAADVHLMPSLREGMGIAVLEAMAVGLPQILAAVPGLLDFGGVAPGVVHITPTETAIAAAIAAEASKPDAERSRTSSLIASEVRRGYSTAVGAARYTELYGQAT